MLQKSSNGKYPVTILKSWRSYNGGEVAGFDLKTSTALCAAGVADPYMIDRPPEGKSKAKDDKGKHDKGGKGPKFGKPAKDK